MNATPLLQHNVEIQENLEHWNRKPLLQMIYRDFHRLIARQIRSDIRGKIVELGSGIGNIKDVIPSCIRTDLFPNPWLDQVENAYTLSFAAGEVSHLILFDVFHHLQYLGTAFKEFDRVLCPGGRVIIFDPCISLLGRLVYGVLHHEPIALSEPLHFDAPPGFDPGAHDYYAAQGNATRIFWGGESMEQFKSWNLVARERYAALSYVLSGGYSKPQVYPTKLYEFMKVIDHVCELVPSIFATRTLIVLEKK